MPDKIQRLIDRISAHAGSGSFPNVSLPPVTALPTLEELSTARRLVRETPAAHADWLGPDEFRPSAFSWSPSRARLFERSKEEYWLRYYGGFGGWEGDAPESVRALYRRGKMRNLGMWTGIEVHEQIESTVKALGRAEHKRAHHPGVRKAILDRAGTPDINFRSEAFKMARRMKERYEDSLMGLHVHSPSKILRLMEHEAGLPEKKLLAMAQTEALKNYRAFTQSRWVNMLKNAENTLLVADELTKFKVDDIPVFAVPDMILQRQLKGQAREVFIVDWKTGAMGKGEAAAYQKQLNVYALAAQKHFGIRANEMKLVLAHMEGGRFNEITKTINQADIDATEAMIRNSAAAMRALGASDVNVADPINFLSAEKYKSMIGPVQGVSAQAEAVAMGRIKEKEMLSDAWAATTVENVWGKFSPKVKAGIKMGGALGGLAVLGWWMFSDSHKRSRRGDPRSRGYGWAPADVRVNPGVSTARSMYESAGAFGTFGAIA